MWQPRGPCDPSRGQRTAGQKRGTPHAEKTNKRPRPIDLHQASQVSRGMPRGSPEKLALQGVECGRVLGRTPDRLRSWREVRLCIVALRGGCGVVRVVEQG
jgi:hypothetical protein